MEMFWIDTSVIEQLPLRASDDLRQGVSEGCAREGSRCSPSRSYCHSGSGGSGDTTPASSSSIGGGSVCNIRSWVCQSDFELDHTAHERSFGVRGRESKVWNPRYRAHQHSHHSRFPEASHSPLFPHPLKPEIAQMDRKPFDDSPCYFIIQPLIS